jgi:hypothetical protein
MERIEKDEEREERIVMEIIVDAYGPEEQALGWYYYLKGRLTFPFRARCVRERRVSPLWLDEEVEVLEMAPDEDCEHGMFVMIQWRDREMGVPLEQLEAVKADRETEEAIGDWRYWVDRGNQLY